MRRTFHRPPPSVAVAVCVFLLVLLAACGGGAGGGGSALDEAAARVEPGTGNGASERSPIAGRCDLGFNTARFNDTTASTDHHDHGSPTDVDFTLEEWAEVFVHEELGMTVEEVVDEIERDEIYRRHVLAGVLTHTLDPDPWAPMTDSGSCEALAAELRESRSAVLRYPTVADAVADGYRQGDTYYAGLGVHYQNWDHLDGGFEPGRPVQLLFDGTDDHAALVGLSYVVSLPGDAPPEGFTGDNDRWHRHRSFCLDVEHGALNLAADVLSQDECEALGGTHVPNTNLWMLHTWIVPGCESDWGIFSAANPRLPFLPPGVRFAPGCDSGKAVGDSLTLDRGGRPLDLDES